MVHLHRVQRLLAENKYLLTLAVFILAVLVMIPGILFSRMKVTDGFLYQVIAYIQLTLNEGHLIPFIKDGYSFNFIEFLPGYPLILSLLSRLGSVEPVQLQFMPIAGMFIPLGYFVISWKLFKSKTISALLALFGACDIGLVSNYNVFAFTWSNLLYFGFLLVYLRLINSRRFPDVVLLFILFFASFFLHYAATMWMIVNILLFNILLYLKPNISESKGVNADAQRSFAMPLAFIITFLGFNKLFFKVWIPSAKNVLDNSVYPFDFLTTKFLSYLNSNSAIQDGYTRFFNPWGSSFGRWRVIEYLVIIMPVLILIARYLVGVLSGKPIKIQPTFTFFGLPLFLTTIVDWAVYGSYSGFNFRYLSLVFPFLSVISISLLSSNKLLQKIYLSILVLAAGMTFYNAYRYYDDFSLSSYEQAERVTNWINENPIKQPGLSDLDTQGMITVLASRSDAPIPKIHLFDTDSYGSMLDADLLVAKQSEYETILAATGRSPVPLHGVSNYLFEPLAFHEQELGANYLLDRIYDDGSYLIYVRTTGELK